MLLSLSIKNFTIVSELHLDFEPGMTAFTGETGAGKSIMIDALSLLLGQRADASVIRDGSDDCELSAAFHIAANPEVLAWLTEHEIEEQSELILRRCLNRSGRSKVFINGVLYPLQKIRELGDRLIHIHGQNEQYHLLKHEVHRAQLDAFAMNDARLAKVKTAYSAIQKTIKNITTLESNIGNENQKTLLDYQLQELEELALEEGEIENLNQEHKRLSSAKDLIETSNQMMAYMLSDDQAALLDTLSQLLSMADELVKTDGQISTVKEFLNNAYIQIEEAHAELLNYQSGLELNPERLYEVEKRIEAIFNLARKHRVKPEALYEHLCQLQQQRQTYLENESQLADLKAQLTLQHNEYHKHAASLSKHRQKEAKLLAKQITQLIHTLGIPNGEVMIDVTPLEKPSSEGIDKVEYQVCLNPGSKPKPLAKIASGGELSRISLAIQVLTAEKKSYPTLMFDEVDTGIGGATAAQVGQLLRRLGNHTQVFCVTHQAQVASNANWHMKVMKSTDKKSTHSQVMVLNAEDKVEELARMISGMEMTEQTRAHAKALLEQVEG
jgi:DNA repair protein RecN (Recombination protein N)